MSGTRLLEAVSPLLVPRRLILGLLLLASAAVADEHTLARVDALRASGAAELALRLIESTQPDPASNLPLWEAYEKRRLNLHAGLPDPAAIARRLAAWPAAAGPDLRRFAQAQLAAAYVAANDAKGARDAYTALLAQAEGAEAARWLTELVRIALAEGRLDEAEALLTRHPNVPASPELHLARAELAVHAGRHRVAFEMLAGVEATAARLLRLKAGLHAGLVHPGDVIEQAAALAQDASLPIEGRRDAWRLRVEAAGRTGQPVRVVSSLEQLLNLGEGDRERHNAAEKLWAAYQQLARDVARKAGLSDTAEWGRYAAGLRAEEGYYARALYAALAQRDDAAGTDEVHGRLADALLAAGLPGTFEALYAIHRYEDGRRAPRTVRYRLLDRLVARGEFRRATEIVRTLDQPPVNASAEGWTLTRARVLLYGGDRQGALVLLSGLLDVRHLEESFAARYLQVLFDLQTLGLHEQALTLLADLYQRVDNPRMRRELLYWQADSLAALGRHREAAQHYLLSAAHAGANPGDPWGQSARVRAGEALAKARLVTDARAVYTGLLRETQDPARRANLEQQVQQLWLLRESHVTTR